MSFKAIFLLPLLLLLFLFTGALFYPGVVDVDAAGVMAEHNTGYLTWHSPVLSFAWGQLQRVWPGPPLLFLAIQATLLGSIFLIVTRAVSGPGRRQIALMIIALHPLTLAIIAYLGKDSIVAALLAASSAALIWLPALTDSARWAAFAALLLCLALAGCIRLDSLVAALPLVGGAVIAVLGIPSRNFLSRAGLVVLAWLAVGAISILTTEAAAQMVHAERGYPFQVTMTWDLAGIARNGGSVSAPGWHHREGVPLERLLEQYLREDSIPMFWPTDRPGVPLTKSKQDYVELKSAWWRAIAHNPLPYLRHRGDFITSLLGIRPQPDQFLINWRPLDYWGDLDKYNARFMRSRFLLLVESLFLTLYQTPLLRPWFSVLILIAALLLMKWRPRPHRDWITAMAWSGLAQVVTMSFAASAAILRYLFWAELAAIILAVVIIVSWRRRGVAPAGPALVQDA